MKRSHVRFADDDDIDDAPVAQHIAVLLAWVLVILALTAVGEGPL